MLEEKHTKANPSNATVYLEMEKKKRRNRMVRYQPYQKGITIYYVLFVNVMGKKKFKSVYNTFFRHAIQEPY